MFGGEPKKFSSFTLCLSISSAWSETIKSSHIGVSALATVPSTRYMKIPSRWKCDKFNSIDGGWANTCIQTCKKYFSNTNVRGHEKAIKMTTVVKCLFMNEKKSLNSLGINGYTHNELLEGWRITQKSEPKKNAINYVREGKGEDGSRHLKLLFHIKLVYIHSYLLRWEKCVSLRLFELIVEMVIIRALRGRRLDGMSFRCQNDITWCFP